MPDDFPKFVSTLDPAAPRFRYSLADLAIAIAVLSLYFAACSQFGPLGFTTATIVFGVGLAVRGSAKKNKAAQWTGAILIILSVLATPMTLLMYAFRDRGPQPVTDQSKWPRSLQHMIKVAGADKTRVKMAINGAFFDWVHYCRMDVSADQVDAIVEDLRLKSCSEANVPQEFWQDFPRAWQPVPCQGAVYFIDTPPYHRDDNYILMYDPQTHWLYVWDWFNF